MNRLAAFAHIAGIVTVSMFVALVTHTPSFAPEAVESTVVAPPITASTYRPGQYLDEERAAHTSELPAQF